MKEYQYKMLLAIRTFFQAKVHSPDKGTFSKLGSWRILWSLAVLTWERFALKQIIYRNFASLPTSQNVNFECSHQLLGISKQPFLDYINNKSTSYTVTWLFRYPKIWCLKNSRHGPRTQINNRCVRDWSVMLGHFVLRTNYGPQQTV